MSRVTIQQAYDLAVQHRMAGRLREAQEIYRQILAHQPEHAAATHDLGLIAHRAGHLDLAVELIRRSIVLSPKASGAYSNLGNVLKDKGHIDEAIAAWRQAIALNPDLPEAHSNLGNALKEKGRLDEAIAAYRRAIALRPDLPQAHGNLGKALHEQGRFDEAIAACRQAIVLLPGSAEAHNDLGAALMDKGQLEEAILAYRRALALKPDYAAAQSNLGLALKAQGRLDEAIAALRHATMLDPSSPETLGNLGDAFHANGQLDETIIAFRQAIALKPDHAEIHFNLALALLLRGNWDEGWLENEWRWKVKGMAPSRGFPQPLFRGQDVHGKTILLHAEQGFGDTIQFVRYAPLLAERGATVILEVQPELKGIVRGVEGVVGVFVQGEALPAFDLHCPMMSLPLAFKTTLDSIPAQVPYLFPETERWRKRVDDAASGLKVGLAWAGSPTHKNDRNRSIALSMLKPLAAVKGIQLYSLQKGEAGKQAAGMSIIDWTTDLVDFSETAGLVAQMDLVISVDTAVAHLAGAMGKPVWVMLPFMAEWRWLREREDSPWYPTMRLFRQKRRGDWEGVIRRVLDAVCALGGA